MLPIFVQPYFAKMERKFYETSILQFGRNIVLKGTNFCDNCPNAAGTDKEEVSELALQILQPYFTSNAEKNSINNKVVITQVSICDF